MGEFCCGSSNLYEVYCGNGFVTSTVIEIDLTRIGILGAASIDYTGADALNTSAYGYVGNGVVDFIDGSYIGNLIGNASFTGSSRSFSLSAG